MLVHFLLENIQKKLPFLNHAVSSKSQLPILLNILLVAQNGKLILSTTDLEIGIQTEIPANIEQEGSITIPAKIFSELIATMQSEKVTLQLEGKNVHIKSQKTKSTLQAISSEEFPKLFEDKGEVLATIDTQNLQLEFAKVAFAASLDTSRPALSGVLIQKEETGFLLVATDGYRLSLNHHTVLKPTEGVWEKPILIPARIIKEVIQLKDGDTTTLSVSKNSNQVLFQTKETLLVGRLIESEYPPFQKIIPTDFGTKVFFESVELQKAVRMCSIFARETAHIIKLSFQKDMIVVSANTPSIGENRVEVEAKVEGEENEIAFNARYLLDLFTHVQDEKMVFEMTGPLNPGVFKIEGNNSFLHLIMPIRVQS